MDSSTTAAVVATQQALTAKSEGVWSTGGGGAAAVRAVDNMCLSQRRATDRY